MSVNLMDMVKQAATQQILGKIGGILGTDEKKTSSVFETAAGSILGGLMKKAGTPQGAKDIFGAVQKQDDSVLDKLGDLLGGGEATDGFQKQGSGILDMVMGNSGGGMIATIAKYLGIDQGVMGKMMMMAAPIVMSVIGRHVKNKALDAVGLGNLLGGQKSHLGSVLPSALSGNLGLGNLLGGAGDAVGNVAAGVGNVASGAAGAVGDAAGAVGGAAGNAGRAVTGAAGDAASAGGGLLKMLLPLLLLAALLFGLWKWVLPAVMGTAADGIDAVGEGVDGITGAAGNLDFKVPGMDALGESGTTLTTGFKDIASGMAGIKDEAGATDFVGKIEGFTNTVGGLGLGDLTGPAATASQGLIGKFVDTIKGLMGGQSEGIQGILKPAIDALMKALGQ